MDKVKRGRKEKVRNSERNIGKNGQIRKKLNEKNKKKNNSYKIAFYVGRGSCVLPNDDNGQ